MKNCPPDQTRRAVTADMGRWFLLKGSFRNVSNGLFNVGLAKGALSIALKDTDNLYLSVKYHL